MLGLKNTRVLSHKQIAALRHWGAGLVVGVILTVALLQGCGRGARGGGAGGFDPRLGQQGGRHGDLDELVSLNQADESFEALERSLRVPLLSQQPLPHVHALLPTQEEAASTS